MPKSTNLTCFGNYTTPFFFLRDPTTFRGTLGGCKLLTRWLYTCIPLRDVAMIGASPYICVLGCCWLSNGISALVVFDLKRVNVGMAEAISVAVTTAPSRWVVDHDP